MSCRLIVVRHAKSSWDGYPMIDDHGRSLTERGRRDARLVGAKLATLSYHPDVVLCSTARRTRQTWECMAGELADPAEVKFLDELYEATSMDVCEALQRECGGEVTACIGTVMVVGHQPAVQTLVRALGRGGGDLTGAKRSPSSGNFPTGAAVVIKLDAGWDDVGRGGKLLRWIVPKRLRGRAD